MVNVPFLGEEIQDTVFISGLPENVSEDELSNYFGAIGIIKVGITLRITLIAIQ